MNLVLFIKGISMFKTKPLCLLAGINSDQFSKEENILLEIDLFISICEELKEIFKINYKEFFRVMKFNKETENQIMEVNFVRCIINDILSTEEYTLHGIAYYTSTPEDVIFELAAGQNTNPSSTLLRKIIELHRLVRPNLYKDIMDKLIYKHHSSTVK